ncbi:MAG TPA: START domain-containing protein [Candidatus Angelobacter sp.]|nr:START domain-containing protein [Candidatus Angelobacter sp.]
MTATSAQIETLGEKKADSPAGKPNRWGRKLVKILFRVSVSVVVLLFFAQLIWRFSGSNRWELLQEKDGIKIYSLKAPGADLLQFRAIGRIHSTLPGVLAWMRDVDACKVQGCTESYEIQRVGEQLQYNYFQYGKRDFVIVAYAYQIPDTKQVVVNISAIPDKVPSKDGYFRITNMNNKWRLTPVENGQVEVEIENNMDPGGFVPNLLFNKGRPKSMHYILTHLESWVAKDKYQNAKFDFIKEKNSPPTTHISQAIPAP